jgi:hypothetical protein
MLPQRSAAALAPPPPPVRKVRTDATGQMVTTKAKMDTVHTATRLREEQIKARVVFYNADQETNKELDEVTAQVVAELRALQASQYAGSKQDKATNEIEVIQALRGLLEKLLSGRRETFVRAQLEQVQRRVTKLFFNSILGGRDDDSARVMQSHDHALYRALRKHESKIIADLEAMTYATPADKAEAIDVFRKQIRQLSLTFLSRTQPVLEKLLKIYCDVLAHFLFQDFVASLGEFSWEVIKESRVAQGQLYGYKLAPEQFAAFRQVFDAKFLEKLVVSMQEPVLDALDGEVSEDALRFAADPALYVEVCTVICNSIYDYLHGEGFLDLPVQWKAMLAQG